MQTALGVFRRCLDQQKGRMMRGKGEIEKCGKVDTFEKDQIEITVDFETQ